MGGFIAALRKARGMTQQEVADRLNVSNKTISKWERDDGYPEITIIPALAELFEVTGDEILRGERIPPGERDPARQAARVEKQIQRIINSNMARFQNSSYLAAALSLTGLICLFTTAYAFYRPVLGFGIALIFAVASITMELALINTCRTATGDHEIMGENEGMLDPLRKTVNRHSFAVFMINTAVIILALPFVLIRDRYYLDSVISVDTYLSLLPALLLIIALICALLLRHFRGMLWRGTLPGGYPREEMRQLNLLQGGALLLAVALGIADVLSLARSPILSFIVGFCALAGLALLFTVVLVARSRAGAARLLLLAAGIRNILYALAAIGASSWIQVIGTAEGEIYRQLNPTMSPALLVLGATAAYLLVRCSLERALRDAA